MKFILVTLVVLLSYSCKNDIENKNSKKNNLLLANDSISIKGTIGVITINDSYQFGDVINIFNKENQPLEPIIIKEELQIFVLKCLSVEDDFYKTKLINGEIGYISKTQKGIEFQTWEKHILSVFSVGFNYEKNPIKTLPDKESESIRYDSDEFYHPVEIKNNWLKIKWGDETKWEYGWISWSDDEDLLIELFYFA
jgi:hypothetical protein